MCPILTSIIQKRHLMLFGHLVRMDESAYLSSSEWLEKAGRASSHLLADHNEEWPIIQQPQCGRCHRAGTGQTTGGYWQQAELCTELVQAEQWWWWWFVASEPLHLNWKSQHFSYPSHTSIQSSSDRQMSAPIDIHQHISLISQPNEHHYHIPPKLSWVAKASAMWADRVST